MPNISNLLLGVAALHPPKGFGTQPSRLAARNYTKDLSQVKMGIRRHFAEQQFNGTKCRDGSKADIRGVEPMSAITPKATVIADMGSPEGGAILREKVSRCGSDAAGQ